MFNDESQEANLEETQTDEPSNEEESEEENQESESEDEQSEEQETDWEAEAKKWKAIAERNKKKQVKSKPKKTEDADEVTERLGKLEMLEQKRAFGHEHGLSPEETDKIYSMNPNPTAETLKDPFVKAGLEAIRKSRRVEENTPSSSNRSTPVVTKKFKEMSKNEQNEEWQKHLRSKGINV